MSSDIIECRGGLKNGGGPGDKAQAISISDGRISLSFCVSLSPHLSPSPSQMAGSTTNTIDDSTTLDSDVVVLY